MGFGDESVSVKRQALVSPQEIQDPRSKYDCPTRCYPDESEGIPASQLKNGAPTREHTIRRAASQSFKGGRRRKSRPLKSIDETIAATRKYGTDTRDIGASDKYERDISRRFQAISGVQVLSLYEALSRRGEDGSDGSWIWRTAVTQTESGSVDGVVVG